MSSPKLSVVVVAHNMARELPRTLQTLSPPYQRDIDAGDYEIIVIDNGSTQPFDHDRCRQLCPNLSIHVMTDASPSPVNAINFGMARARGELVGVCIDGARMASPRLLATALEAAQLHPRPVVGTFAFHLGPSRQILSTTQGYSRIIEDQLLASVDWTGNGYSLFSISVFAGSSIDGWFVLPAESNALFLKREHWQGFGGYDPAFAAPGGGLVNLDVWLRACADPTARVILLLGEGTFHQLHRDTPEDPNRWEPFHDEYVRVRGMPYVRPALEPLFYGRFPAEALPSVQASVASRLRRNGVPQQ